MNIEIEEFQKRVGIRPGFTARVNSIVSLRELDPKHISGLQVMPRNYLESLIRNISLEGDEEHKPYAECEISLMRIDPHSLVIGQTFIQREKYQSILEGFGLLLDKDFCVPRGVAKKCALIIFGKTFKGDDAVAHYLPPIIEATNGTQFLIDGIHRSFIVKNTGTTIESIILKNVKTPLPCEAMDWESISFVDEKPPRQERFRNLQPQLFRNLKFTGIDG